MMIDRTLAPAFKQVENINIIKAEKSQLDNGIPVYMINAGEQELVRVELIFKNVNWDVTKPLQAYAVNSMLTDGTSSYSASQIAEGIDYYGAFLQNEYSNDHTAVTIYSLNKQLKHVLPFIKSIVTDSVFPEAELETFKRNQKQKLSVKLEKNDFVSRQLFNRALFGDTIYGHGSNMEDYDNLDREQLITYFKQAYQPTNCTIIIAGKVGEEAIALLNEFFGKGWETGSKFSVNEVNYLGHAGKEWYVEKPDALQSALRIGQVCVNRTHPDFTGLQVLNTVLGGYFGSRLMANIREEKGFTYGIGSALVSQENAGYFFIASEVGAEVCNEALTEIEKEINILKTVLIPDEELSLVRNYMLGSMLGSLENAFSHADKFKNIHFFGLDYDYFDRYIETVKTISPQQLLDLANKYLDYKSFERVVVGKKTF